MLKLKRASRDEREVLFVQTFGGLPVLGVGLVCAGDGFVVFLELAHLLEPIVFAIDGTHVVDDGVQVDFFVVIIFVRHVLNITKKRTIRL